MTEMMLHGRRMLFLLVNGFDAGTYEKMRHCLEINGANIEIASPTRSEVLLSAGHEVRETSNISFTAALEQTYDAVVIADGITARQLQNNHSVMQLIKITGQHKGSLVAAVGDGVLELIHSGIVKGAVISASPDMEAELLHAGARRGDAPLSISRNIFTARRDADLAAFCQAIIDYFIRGIRAKAA